MGLVTFIGVIVGTVVGVLTLARWAVIVRDYYKRRKRLRRKPRPARTLSSFKVSRSHSPRRSASPVPLDVPEVYPDAVAHGAYAEARLARYRREGLRTVTRQQRRDS